MSLEKLNQKIEQLQTTIQELVQESATLVQEQNIQVMAGANSDFFALFALFVMACFVGYFVVWSVTPALHSPLMGVTNAISSVIIVGALTAAGGSMITDTSIYGFIAVVLASVNIFGGFMITYRMLAMFKKKTKKQ